MNKILRWSIALIAMSTMGTSCYYDLRVKEKDAWKAILDKHEMVGGFELYDNNTEIATYYDKAACSNRYSPGSSFHLTSAIIGLEKSVVLDESKPIHWVSKLNDTAIDASLNLRNYFEQQHQPFFSALHKEIGKANMQWGLDTLKYGNMTISDGAYWKDGTLTISLDEQLGIMKRLYFKEIKGISGRVQTIMLSMLLKEQNDKLKLYYDISPAVQGDTTYYWAVGVLENYNVVKNPKTDVVEKKVHPYFFAMHVHATSGNTLDEKKVLSAIKDFLVDYNLIVE